MSVENSDIELRSNKVRGVIGRIPNKLIRFGISTIFLCLWSIFFLLYFLPYPTYEELQVNVSSFPEFIVKYAQIDGVLDSLSGESIQADSQLYVIRNYSEKYVETSPMDGNITFFCAEKTKIQKGDVVCKIVPFECSELYSILKLESDLVNKISEGQKVSFYSDNDPVQKSYDGYVYKIYPSIGRNIPHYVKILIEVEPEDRVQFLHTSSMSGRIKILLTNKSFLKRIFNGK